MNIFQKLAKPAAEPMQPVQDVSTNQAVLAEKVLNSIADGVMIIDAGGMIKLINPAATTMTGNTNFYDLLGLSYLSIMKLENGEGAAVSDGQNPLIAAIAKNEQWSSRDFILVTAQGQKTPVAITVAPTGEAGADLIITFRNIAQELAKEGEQTEFISTASHEMRTPVASIEGYLGLALNPATATIDERARQYLTEAHNASQHLGKLFRDLLDVTKLDDKRLKVHLQPVDVISAVREMAQRQIQVANTKHLDYSFGSGADYGGGAQMQIDQLAYAMVDLDFLQEVVNNLIENAVKYTPEGGVIWVNVRGDGEQVLINVTDTGMGISPDNLTHIFQKFYRVDNSQTRTIGGTGLGLYIVKQRVEAMGGRVWAESAFGEGSTFYVSLPRLSQAEYEKQRLVYENTQRMAVGTPVAEAPVVAAAGQAAVGMVEPAAVAAEVAPVETAQVEPVSEATPVEMTEPVAVAVAAVSEPVETLEPVPGSAADMTPDKLAEMKARFAAAAKSSEVANKPQV